MEPSSFSSHDGLFVRTEPVKDIFDNTELPDFLITSFHAFLAVLLLSDTKLCQCPRHYLGHLVRTIFLEGASEHYTCSQKTVHNLCPAESIASTPTEQV